jgi:hypothetical protein
MPDYTSPLARVFALLGAVAVAVSTLIAWYDYEVVLSLGRLVQLFEVPINLWNHDPLAAAILLAAALVSMALIVVPPALGVRWPSALAGLIGLGIAAYALYRCFATPDLGVRAVAHPGVQARTYVDGGPLLALVGGAMMMLGSAVVLFGTGRETSPRATRVAPAPPRGAAPA